MNIFSNGELIFRAFLRQKQEKQMIPEHYRHTTLPPTQFPELFVDTEKCKGCGRCVKTCPIQLLTLVNKKAASNERYDFFRCINCENCMAVCPENAIRIEGDYRVEAGYWKNDTLYDNGKIYPEFSESVLTETEKIIYKRRSIRLYKQKQVPKDMIRRVIEAGRYAPSAGNNQPWKFIVIQDKEIIQKISKLCYQTLKFATYLSLPHEWLDIKNKGNKNAGLKTWQELLLPFLVMFYKGDADQRARGGVNAVTSDPEFDTTFGAPTLILILSDKRAIGGTELDLGICAQNMVIAAHAMGLGTCYVGLIDQALRFHTQFKKEIGITAPFKIVTAITLGYPKGTIDTVVRREKARIHWIAHNH
jgi:nitroreductase/Pyruvate/2-oxoacid:ferredoxin oxidoreductase delta subunit